MLIPNYNKYPKQIVIGHMNGLYTLNGLYTHRVNNTLGENVFVWFKGDALAWCLDMFTCPIHDLKTERWYNV